MSRPIIAVENLSKCYHLGTIGATSLRDTFARTWESLRGRAPAVHAQEFWALRDVSFSVQPGEVVGIIGRNGAGKSTLLKILSRITEPTSGRARLRGRTASLLEVGTGFHPELTGRENVFLNGAILGMSRAEVSRKFDEIVAFSEVEQFIDTPVKRYSSGMYVRLAFAVAAHLEPEILIVDEVLAVGDSQFQAKCVGKMRQVSGEDGRTVLFVSHNMLTVQSLCTRAILFKAGRILLDGAVGDVLAHYAATGVANVYEGRPDPQHPKIVSARVTTSPLLTSRPVEIEVTWNVPPLMPRYKIGIGLNTPEDQRIFDWMSEDTGLAVPQTAGDHRLRLRLPPHTLMARTYHVSVGLWWQHIVFDHANPAFTLSLEASPGGPYDSERTRQGLVHVRPECELLA